MGGSVSYCGRCDDGNFQTPCVCGLRTGTPDWAKLCDYCKGYATTLRSCQCVLPWPEPTSPERPSAKAASFKTCIEPGCLWEAEANLDRCRGHEMQRPGTTLTIGVDPVNHPPHYQGKVETIDAIESALGLEGFRAYCRGNAIKYLSRLGKKGPAAEDAQKAQWYVDKLAGSYL